MLGGISIWQLLIVLVIVALIFGTKKLRGIGGDLGGAVKGFKKAIDDKPKEGEVDGEVEEAAVTDAKVETEKETADSK